MTTATLDNLTPAVPSLADCGIDVMARLTSHMRAAVTAEASIGEPITMSSAFYGDALGDAEVGAFIKRAALSHKFGCRISSESGYAPSVSLWCLKGSYV